MEYPLCQQTVTLYRKQGDTLLRQVVEGCYLEWKCQAVPGDARQERQFMLVMPGNIQRVFPGDRILEGVGPEEVDWERFLPVYVDGLLIVEHVKRFYWNGALCHVEAG